MKTAYHPLLLVLCIAGVAGLACAEQLYKDHLINPSFERGEEGKEPYGWGAESSAKGREPYVWKKGAVPPGDKTSFVKARGGRPGDGGEPTDAYAAHLTVRGNDTWAMGAQTVVIDVKEPTQFTFSAWIRCVQDIPPGDHRPYICLIGLKLDEAGENWIKVRPAWDSTNVTPTPEWKKYSVSVVCAPDVPRLTAHIGSYTRGAVIEVDDVTLIREMPVPEFDVDKEGGALARIVKDAGKGNAKAAGLQKLFDRIKARLATANDKDSPEAERRKAAAELPGLIQDYFAEKEALKGSLLDSLFE